MVNLKYHKAFNDYWLTQDEDCANKLNEIRLLINNNFEEALCIVGIKFTGIDWILFESRVKDKQVLFEGYAPEQSALLKNYSLSWQMRICGSL